MTRPPIRTGTAEPYTGEEPPRRWPTPGAAAARRGLLPRAALTIVLNIVVPFVVYALVRPRVGSDALALAIGASIPVAVTAVGFVVRRRLDPVGVAAILSAAVAFIVLLLTGDNPLALKLQDALITGPLGLVGLVSVLVRRPLLEYVRRLTAARGQRAPSALRGAALQHAMSVLTALIGGTLLAHAVLMVVLALTMSTTTFLGVGRAAGWVLIAAGLLAVFVYRKRMGAGAGHAPGDPSTAPGDDSGSVPDAVPDGVRDPS
jgi:hypothetical protein